MGNPFGLSPRPRSPEPTQWWGTASKPFIEAPRVVQPSDNPNTPIFPKPHSQSNFNERVASDQAFLAFGLDLLAPFPNPSIAAAWRFPMPRNPCSLPAAAFRKLTLP